MISLTIAYLAITLLLAHALAPRGYSWTEHTVSALAGQGERLGWIMRIGFMGFGPYLVTALALDDRVALPAALPLFAFAACWIPVGLFRTGSIDEARPRSETEQAWHDRFSLLAGVFFGIGVIVQFLVSPSWTDRAVHIGGFLLAGGGAVAFFLVRPVRGAFMRLMYLGWMGWFVLWDLAILR